MVTPSKVRLLVVLGILGVAAIAIAATAGSTHRSAGGVKTPALMMNGPKYQQIGAPLAGADGPVLFGCQTRPITGPGTSCYGPDQIRRAYGIQPLLDRGVTGKGRTIVIVDAYGQPTIQDELKDFDALWELPDTTLNVIFPDGPPSATTEDNAFGWGVETSLDVEWSHVVAPAATIDLVVAKSNDDADILSATRYAVNHNLGDVISQSFGEAEQCMDPGLLSQQHQLFQQAVKKNITLLASAGDDGAANGVCDPNSNGLFKSVSTPATDPNVTAVGGTQLNATPAVVNPADGSTVDPGGQYIGETVWNEGVGASTGGGVSTVYSKPAYQFLVPSLRSSRMRWIPDIAYNAAIQGGVIVEAHCPASVCGTDQEAFFRVGGTSAGSPQWAGLTALTDQIAHSRVGGLNNELYLLGSTGLAPTFFHDVTVGNNSVPADPDTPGTPITGYSAAPGWDPTTGFGSPKANTLVPALVASVLLP